MEWRDMYQGQIDDEIDKRQQKYKKVALDRIYPPVPDG
jgi:hypothetical protein